MKIIFGLIFVLLICIFGCDKSISTETKQFSLIMNRTNCLGSCPVYSLKINVDGKVEFEGIEFTEIKGKAESKLSEEKIKELISKINKSNFFFFKDDYGYDSKKCSFIETDSPTVTLTIKFNEQEKTINHYHGCIIEDSFIESWFEEKDNLQTLTDLEDKIDEIAEVKRWIGERK